MAVAIHTGDCREVLRSLPSESVQCCVTSPPYWGLRDYGVDGQIGLEQTPEAYVAEMVAVFAEVRRVLRADGTVWVNLGDSYAGARGGAQGESGQLADREASRRGIRYRGDDRLPAGCKPKDLVGIPWRVAFALQADGWWLRSDIVWSKPNPMPESVTDRPTKAHEYVFLLAKSERYYYDAAAVREEGAGRLDLGRMTSPARLHQGGDWTATEKNGADGRNARTVWTIATQPYTEAHFATFPEQLAQRCIMAGCPVGGTVLDPFGGSGTVGRVAEDLGRHSILIELNPQYAEMARRRTAQGGLLAIGSAQHSDAD